MVLLKILFSFVFAACSSTGRAPAPSLQTALTGRAQNIISQPVSEIAEAEAILNRKKNYFRALFEQSFDPYYGTPKFDEQCLKENTIGEIFKTSGGIFLPMVLALDSKFEAGFCTSSKSLPISLNHMIYFFCSSSKSVNRLIVATKPGDEGLDWSQLCP